MLRLVAITQLPPRAAARLAATSRALFLSLLGDETARGPTAWNQKPTARRRRRVSEKWLEWSASSFAALAEAAAADIAAVCGDDAIAGRQLVQDLCEATRSETVRQGAFANAQSHAAYVRRNLASRAASLASLLLLDLLVRGKHTEDVAPEEVRAIARARRDLFFSRREIVVLALGGGPGFEAVAVATLAEYLGSGVDIVVYIADSEAAWLPTAAAVHRAAEARRTTGRAGSLTFRFVHADVTCGLDDDANAALEAVVAAGVDLLVCAYVLVETAQLSRANGWRCLRDCAARLSTSPRGCHVVALDSTHRVWPEVIAALKSAAPEHVSAWLPRHPVNRKVSLLACIGGATEPAAEDILAARMRNGGGPVHATAPTDALTNAEAVWGGGPTATAHFHACDFEWSELQQTAALRIDELHQQHAEGGALDGAEARGIDVEDGGDDDEDDGVDVPAAGRAVPSGSTTSEADQIARWERHFLRHEAAPTPFFKERRSLLKQFPLLTHGTPDVPLRVLEVGCGNGSSALSLLRGNMHVHVHATDPSPAAVEQAQAAISDAGLAQRLTTAVQPTPTTPAAGLSAPVDVSMILFTLSAVPGEGDVALLAASCAAVKPGGAVLVRDYGLYDTRHLNDARKSLLLTSSPTMHEYLRPGGMHRRYYSLERVAQIAAACGLVVEESRYLCNRLHNAKRALTLNRVYIHAVLRKPDHPEVVSSAPVEASASLPVSLPASLDDDAAPGGEASGDGLDGGKKKKKKSKAKKSKEEALSTSEVTRGEKIESTPSSTPTASAKGDHFSDGHPLRGLYVTRREKK